MPIENSASSVLGPDPRLQLAPVSDVAAGSQGGAISSGVFRQMDQKFLQRAEQILTTKDRIASMKDRESARIQGNMAMKEITRLDPTSEDYLAQRNTIISRYPKAALDETANKFLDLQEDEFTIESRRREYEFQRNKSAEIELDKMERYAENADARLQAQAAKERLDDVRRMSSPAQTAYYAALNSGQPADVAFAIATSAEEQSEVATEYLRSGGTSDDLYVEEQVGDNKSILRPRSERELAELEGARKREDREREIQERRVTDLDDQNRLVTKEIERLNAELNSDGLLNMDTESREAAEKEIREKIATLQSRSDTYRQQLANLRGLQSGPQGAGSSSSPAGGGSSGTGSSTSKGASSISGASLVKPRN